MITLQLTLFERIMRKQVFRYASFAIVLLVAFAVRLYKIDSPLWLDEIFGYRLARLGVEAIIQNSWTDPHPPFYYLMQWVVSGFGYTQSEIGWRWIPLLSGVLAIAVTGIIVRDITDSFTTIIICLIAATLPTLVFYSQEARSFSFLILLASLSMWFIVTILRDPYVGRRLWTGWIITSLLGLFTGYAYLMVASIQLAFLGFYFYRRAVWWVATVIIIIGLLILLPFMASSLAGVASQHVGAKPLTFWRTVQTLFAGEPIRYGFSLSHTILPLAVIGLYIVAFIKTIRLGDNRLAYFLIQVALPMGMFFALSPLLSIRLPLSEAKQFVILIPACLVLIASGLAELRHRLGHRNGTLLVTAVCGAMIFLNAIGLQSYWTYPKSPEGLAIFGLRDKLQAGEAVVSLHYSLNYALGFYTSGIPIYLNPMQDGDSYRYRLITTEHIFDPLLISPSWIGTENIRASGKFWVLAHSASFREPIVSLISGCQILEQEKFSALNGSFEIMKVDCANDRE